MKKSDMRKDLSTTDGEVIGSITIDGTFLIGVSDKSWLDIAITPIVSAGPESNSPRLIGWQVHQRTKTDTRERSDEWPYEYESPADGDAPGARETDPATSHKASFNAAPRAGSQREQSLICIIRYFNQSMGDGLTYKEVEVRTGIQGCWKRLSELEQGGWIYPSGTRLVSETGSEARVYYPTDKAHAYFRDR